MVNSPQWDVSASVSLWDVIQEEMEAEAIMADEFSHDRKALALFRNYILMRIKGGNEDARVTILVVGYEKVRLDNLMELIDVGEDLIYIKRN